MKRMKRIMALFLLVFLLGLSVPVTSFAAGELLPAGYVSMEEWEETHNTEYGLGDISGLYVVPYAVLSGFLYYDATDGISVDEVEGFFSPPMSNTSPFELKYNHSVGSFSESGQVKFDNEENDISWDDFKYSLDYTYSITVTDLCWDDTGFHAQLSGNEKYTNSYISGKGNVFPRNGKAALKPETTQVDIGTSRDYQTNKSAMECSLWYLNIYAESAVDDKDAEDKEESVILACRILAVLPSDAYVAGNSTEEEESPYPEGYEVNEEEGTATVTVDAPEEAGESGFVIPPVVLITLVGLLGLGIAIGIGSAKGKGKGKNNTPKPVKKSAQAQSKEKQSEEKQEKDTEKTYEMRIRKDFGDTLAPGQPQTVYARIVEVIPGKSEKTELTLTRQIVISSPDGLQISNVRMDGAFLSAQVTAPETVTRQEKGTVVFDLAGAFVLNMHFKLEHEEVRFFQENLTIPAFYGKNTSLPFYIATTKDALVTARIKPEGTYEVKVEPGEEDYLMNAVITETGTKKYDPGTVEQFLLEVWVNHNGKEEALGSLAVYRFHMGFKVQMGPSVGCHYELKDEVWMSGMGGKRFYDARDYRPARTDVEMAIYDWDEEAHEVLFAAIVPKDYKFTALDAENQDKLEKLGVDLQIDPNPTGKGRHGIFVCTKGLLDPPTRFKAKLEMKAEFNGKAYSFEKEVIMASQKWRLTSEIADNFEKDLHLTQQLTHLKNSIENSEDLTHLFPLVKYIGIMLDGYSETYGYDPRQVERVKDIYSRYMNGELLGANAQPQIITFADELEMFISAFIDTGAQAEDSLGFWGNLAIGILSLGYSDAIFATFKAAKSMKDYVERGGDSAWGAFYVGVSTAVTDFAMNKASELAMGAALKAAKGGTKAAASLAKELSPNRLGKAVTATEQAFKKTKDYLSEKVGKKIKNVLEKSKGDKQKVKNNVRKDIIESNKRPMSADEIRLEKLESNGNKAAKVKLDDLEAARQVAETWPTTENKEFFRKKVLEVQQDKSAMLQLKTKPDADDLRASFNREMKDIYENTDTRVRKYFEEKGQPLRKKVQNATNANQKALANGQTVTMDRDVTYYAEDGGLLKQKEAQEAYEKMFYKETRGVDPPSAEAAHNWAKLNDQSVVQKTSAEHYGNQHDLDAMLKNHDEALLNPEKVGKVVEDKGLEWMKEGQELIDQAKKVTDPVLKDHMTTQGLQLRKEGMRQITKQYNYVDARDLSRACESGKIRITEELRYGVEMFNNTLTDGPTHISVAKCESLLKEKGMTLEGVAEMLGRITTLIG